MTTPLIASPLSAPIPNVDKKKRVLLLDTSSPRRDLRSEVMRKLGMDVDCAADVAEARSWWKAELYDLVLIDVERDHGHRDKFCADIRGATPPQQLAFLVGRPEYLSASPNADEERPLPQYDDDSVADDVRAALTTDVGDLPQRWGILEASRRISAVRSSCTARTRAMQNLPAPPRDAEGRAARRTGSTTLDDLLREEMQ